MDVIAGKYQVEKALGEGSFGNVFLVKHTDLGSKFALKLLRRELSENKRFVDRFKGEAEALLRFHHKGSVQMRDFGRTEDGLYYLVTDYCEGRPLNEVLAEQVRLDPKLALEIVAQVLDVLQAAHDSGIIHRDIKPANVLLERIDSGREEVRVLDFGVAKIKDEMVQEIHHASGGAVGTPAYMSPEQAAGESGLDHRVDVYACGVMLYELLSGRTPFDDDDVVQILIKHLTQPPPPFAPAFGISEAIEKVVLKALAKEREKRFISAAEFAVSVRDLLEGLGEKRGVRQDHLSSAQKPLFESLDKQGGIPVLCLDDNEMILHILQHLLQSDGFQPVIANNFALIHDFIFKADIRIMVCDVNMPGLPGNKICQLLKKAKPELNIILFSNIPERELERLAKESNADMWLSKNEKPQVWLAGIREIAKRIS